MKISAKTISTLLIAIGFINFFAFFAVSQSLGVNRWHGASLIVTHPLAIAGMFYLLLTDKFPKMIFRGQVEERVRKEKKIASFGAAKASFSCSGKIGPLSFGGPLLKATIYPKGIHFKPFLMPAFAIPENEIKSVQVHKSFLKKGVEITHTSPEIASPIFPARHHCYCGADRFHSTAIAVPLTASFDNCGKAFKRPAQCPNGK